MADARKEAANRYDDPDTPSPNHSSNPGMTALKIKLDRVISALAWTNLSLAVIVVLLLAIIWFVSW